MGQTFCLCTPHSSPKQKPTANTVCVCVTSAACQSQAALAKVQTKARHLCSMQSCLALAGTNTHNNFLFLKIIQII